jgi:F-type H+-transporting ATPase subunit delta
MLIPRVAKRYAEAIYEAVPAELGLDVFLADLRDLRASLQQSRDLRNFFLSPVIPYAKKETVITDLFGATVRPYTLSVIHFLLHKRREHLIEQVIEAVFDLHRTRTGIQRAAITSARPLSAEQQQSLDSVLAGMTGGAIESSFAINEQLLGGVVVRLDDKVYDGSVSRQLQRLKHRFTTGADA